MFHFIPHQGDSSVTAEAPYTCTCLCEGNTPPLDLPAINMPDPACSRPALPFATLV